MTPIQGGSLTARPDDPPPRLVLYDGACAVCDGAVQFLLAHDRAGALHYAPLQGETAARVRARHPEWPPDLDSLVLVEQTASGERVSWYSTGVLRMMAVLPWPWRALHLLRIVPRILRDALYRGFAARRIGWFGTVSSCRLPTEAQQQRLHP